jgi:hypothetical protein
MTKYIFIIAILLCVLCAPKQCLVVTETKLQRIDPNWLEYANRSSVKLNEIDFNKLQGKWIANIGFVKFEDTVEKRTFVSNEIIINGNKIKRGIYQFVKEKESDLKENEFKLIQNKMFGFSEDPFDTIIINMITSDSLILTSKYIPPKYKADADNKTNSRKIYLTRYYYKKTTL